MPSGLAKRATRRAKLCKASKNEEARDRVDDDDDDDGDESVRRRARSKERSRAEGQVGARSSQALREFRGVPPIPKSVLLFFFFLSQPTTPVCVDGREDAEPRGLVRVRSKGLHDHRWPPTALPFSILSRDDEDEDADRKILFSFSLFLVETQASTPERTTRRAISR